MALLEEWKSTTAEPKTIAPRIAQELGMEKSLRQEDGKSIWDMTATRKAILEIFQDGNCELRREDTRENITNRVIALNGRKEDGGMDVTKFFPDPYRGNNIYPVAIALEYGPAGELIGGGANFCIRSTRSKLELRMSIPRDFSTLEETSITEEGTRERLTIRKDRDFNAEWGKEAFFTQRGDLTNGLAERSSLSYKFPLLVTPSRLVNMIRAGVRETWDWAHT